MAAVFRWSLRLFALLAMLLFAALMVIFIIVTVDQFGEKQYVTDSVGGLPPVYVLTAVLVPFCALFVAGFWMLFLDSFRDRSADLGEEPIPGPLPPAPPTLFERARDWTRAHRPHRPHWPGGAD
jgi:TRAP-type C4-dicarboxylate transport system permease small subunit